MDESLVPLCEKDCSRSAADISTNSVHSILKGKSGRERSKRWADVCLFGRIFFSIKIQVPIISFCLAISMWRFCLFPRLRRSRAPMGITHHWFSQSWKVSVSSLSRNDSNIPLLTKEVDGARMIQNESTRQRYPEFAAHLTRSLPQHLRRNVRFQYKLVTMMRPITNQHRCRLKDG